MRKSSLTRTLDLAERESRIGVPRMGRGMVKGRLVVKRDPQHGYLGWTDGESVCLREERCFLTTAERVQRLLQAVRHEASLAATHLLVGLRHLLQLRWQQVAQRGIGDDYLARLRISRLRSAEVREWRRGAEAEG